MSTVSPLRSPYEKVGRLVYFGRMLDKIRLHAKGELPEDYRANLGDERPRVLDARCCRFLGVSFATVVEQVAEGGSDEEILAWAEANGTPHSDEECEIWNRFMMKLGWRDDRSEVIQQRIKAYGIEGKGAETFFDVIDCDEGRDPATTKPWNS